MTVTLPPTDETATCTRCGRELPVSAFYLRREPRSKMGRQSWCKTCQNERINAYRRTQAPEHRAALRRASQLRLYGLTPETFDAMLTEQNGRCAICRNEPDARGLVVDHCHATGRVRGLLCVPCNVGLGNFAENEAIMRSAIEYLAPDR